MQDAPTYHPTLAEDGRASFFRVNFGVVSILVQPTSALRKSRRFRSMFGFKQWNSNFPCPRCMATKGNMHDYDRCVGIDVGWEPFDIDAYNLEVASRTILVTIETFEQSPRSDKGGNVRPDPVADPPIFTRSGSPPARFRFASHCHTG